MKRKTVAIIAVIAVLVFSVLIVESINLSPISILMSTHLPYLPFRLVILGFQQAAMSTVQSSS